LYDALGRVSAQTRPYRAYPNPEPAQWTTYEYDWQGRVKKITAPDTTSITEYFYNQSNYPGAATQNAAGQLVLARDPWGRERWARFDEQNRIVEVVEPDPADSNNTGSVYTSGLKTSYAWNTLGHLTGVTQDSQTRSFRYDALGRLTHQKLAERDATLNDNGDFIATRQTSPLRYTGGTWSDVFKYDTRSNLIQRIDARGVRINFNYFNDPLNRLIQITYDKSGVTSQLLADFPIPDAINVSSFAYLTTGDKMRLEHVYMDYGFGNEDLAYDSEGRLNSRTIFGWMQTRWEYDTLDRVKKMYYPLETGTYNVGRELVPAYDIASRLSSLNYDGTQITASNIQYNADSQTLSLNVGSAATETYTYQDKTGLLTSQQLVGAGQTHLNLTYNYTLTNDQYNNAAKTGQLTGITDLINNTRNRAYVYDPVGRLKQVKGGTNAFSASPQWQQSYTYDRYGNRQSVTMSGAVPGNVLDGIPSMTHEAASNRIAGYEYDPAGNVTRGQADNTTWQKYRYDSAGRLAQVCTDGGTPLETYSYGASNQRLRTTSHNSGGAAVSTVYYAWSGGQVIAEYDADANGNNATWRKSYISLGGRLLGTTEKTGSWNTVTRRYHHPDRLGTRIVTDANGAKVSEQVTLPFGTALDAESSGTATSRRFTSYDRSAATKLDYAVNRFYNAAQGRFTQVAPIGVSAASLEDPQTLNLYAYCGNDPINHTDPDGLFFGKLFKWIGKAFKFLFKVAAVALFVVAIILLPTMLAAGGFWLSSGAWFGWGSWFGLMGAAGAAGLAGWHNGTLGRIAGAFLTTLGKSGNFKTPSTFPSGTGVSGVSRFLAAQGTTREDFMQAAVNAALNALRDARCRDLIVGKQSKNPAGLLRYLQAKGRLQVGDIPYGQARAFTRGDGKGIFGKQSTIIFDKYIFPTGDVRNEKGYVDVLGLTTVLGASDPNIARATLILHELSHATARNDRFHTAYGGDAEKLNKEIHTVCFGGK
jgi:RHS repeat-associated protein